MLPLTVFFFFFFLVFVRVFEDVVGRIEMGHRLELAPRDVFLPVCVLEPPPTHLEPLL